jgi:hypothetical protein
LATTTSEEPPRKRGLAAVEQHREARSKIRWPPAKFWAYTALVLAVMGILHWKWSQGELESQRQQLMAKQRAVAAELGPRWLPLRDKIERWTVDLAKDNGPDLIDKDALAKFDFRDKAGLYLRMKEADATSGELIRKKAKDSLRDAFTSCLIKVGNADPIGGKECHHTRECMQGEFCNEQDHCSRPAQPFNLRVAYRTMNVLTDEWVRDAQDASTDIRLRLLEAGFDDTMRDDVPLAADLLTRAQYYLVVLDAGDAQKSLDQIELTAHTAKVGIWRLSDGKAVVKVKRDASGELLGGTPNVDPEALEARQRQANSCGLALQIRQAIGDQNAAATAPDL